MMLLNYRVKGRTNNTVCLELVNEEREEELKINFIEVVKTLLKVCKDLQLSAITTISRKGYKTVILMNSNDVQNCENLFKIFIDTYSSKNIRVEEVECVDFLDKVSPL
ncbi:MAG: hypothetical protein RMH77_04520 [Sulfolobales archaeon]|nr:hypothetical protein [Sulfolobales archaeon]MCX8185705.1 hypothetical protein [Sulfolobales archaeon]MDW7969648.1 hypothetical protein [Sulfolobales archaeon]